MAQPQQDRKPGRYDFTGIERRWQQHWEENETFRAANPGEPGFDPDKPKFYILDMFPYPSGSGLHVGHPVGYCATDIVARHKRLRLAEARCAYESAVRDLATKQFTLPATEDTRRALFDAVMRAKPELQGLLTAQFRNLETLGDADIESCLRQFRALGILDEFSEDPE